MLPLKKRVLLSVRRLNRSLQKTAMQRYVAVVRLLLRDYPRDVAEPVDALLEREDWLGLILWAETYESKCDAKHVTAAEYFAVSQLVYMIKKYPFPLPRLKSLSKAEAMEKFAAAEERCRRYNLVYRSIYNDRRYGRSGIISSMQDFCLRVLGEEPDLQAIYALCSHGPGASVGVHGDSTNFARKMLSEEWTCTPLALPYAVACLSNDHHMFELLIGPDQNGVTCLDVGNLRKRVIDKVRLVQHNKIVTVPKTALVDRTIAIEPLLNGYLQKGIDSYMRLRLKRVGLDLSNQLRNQRLAYRGSLPDQADPFVTIDLSSASDSISKELVRRVLPPAWFNLLNQVRSTHYMDGDGVEKRYHKFVSMGNGFCFPLETLLFASVANRYAKANDYSVYGDDIVVRQSVAQQVIKDLWRVGFRHNPDKTFLEGPFRESCGADWHAGRRVRPLVLDYALDSFENIVKFHNMSNRYLFWRPRFQQIREYLRSLIPEDIMLVRPYEAETHGAFEVELDVFQASPFSRWDRDVQAWQWYELVSKTVPDRGVERHDRFSTVLAMAAVRGYPSHAPFARRRKTTQSVRLLKAYAGGHSTWLPPEYS